MKLGQTPAETNMEKILNQRVNPQFLMVNEDRAFKAAYRWENVGNNQTRYAVIQNPTSDVEMYIIGIETWAFANTRIDYYLDPTFTPGTEVPAVPYRLGSGATSQMKVYVLESSDITDTGTLILPEGIPGGERRFAQGGSNEGFIGFSLLPGHSLLIVMKNVGSNTGDMGFKVMWWEIKKGGWSP